MMDYPLSRSLREHKNTSQKRETGRIRNRYLACYQKFSRAYVGLRETDVVFRAPRIWPDQCQEAIALFTDLQNTSANLSDLLTDMSVLPKEVRYQRYPLLLSIGQVDAECRKIVSFLVELPYLNINSNHGRERYEEVRYLLRSIQSNLNELMETLHVERMNPLLSSAYMQ